MIFSVILFILMICSIVVVHEMGHFIVARRMGIEVREFFVGFGPTIFSFEKGGTLFSLKCIPLGGACVFDDGEDEEDKSKLSEGSFYNAGVWARIATVVAGPLFNFILAFLLALIVVGSTYCDKPVIQDVIEGFPAREAGMQAGDRIIALNGERIFLSREMGLLFALRPGEPIDVTYVRDGEKHSVHLIPKLDEESGRLLYGFSGYAEYFRGNPLQVIQYSIYELRYDILSTIKGFAMLFTGKVGADQMTGPVGIAVLVDDVTKQTMPYGVWVTVVNLLSLAMLISANLGVVNLFPIPALDGGRLLFMIAEVLRGKPVPPEKENIIHLAGFVILIILGVLVFFNDISRIFNGGFK